MDTTSAFPYRIPPISNISPFSYRDGATYLEILYALRDYVVETVVPGADASIQAAVDQFQAGISNAEATITAQNGDWTTQFNAYMADVNASLQALNDTAMGSLINTPTSATATALSALYGDTALAAGVNTPASALRTALDALYGGKATVDALDALTATGRLTQAALDAAYVNEGDYATDKETTTTALGTKADATATTAAISLIESLYTVDPIDVVFIGDSYFTGYQPLPTPYITPIPDRVTALLNARGPHTYRAHNYAGNAGGYNTTYGGGDTYFSTQVNTAVNDPAITNCKLIIVGGGRNDSNSGLDVFNNASTLYAQLKAKWPGAKLVVFPMWTREKFTENQLKTFKSIYRAARHAGAVYDVNSLWVNVQSDPSQWIDTVLHPMDAMADDFAAAIFSVLQGGRLPAQNAQLSVHSSTGYTNGYITIDGFLASISFQQTVGAAFDSTYVLATIPYPAMYPGGANQYTTGYSGNGANLTLYTITAATGNITATTTGVAGVVGLNGSYPLGM